MQHSETEKSARREFNVPTENRTWFENFEIFKILHPVPVPARYVFRITSIYIGTFFTWASAWPSEIGNHPESRFPKAAWLLPPELTRGAGTGASYWSLGPLRLRSATFGRLRAHLRTVILAAVRGCCVVGQLACQLYWKEFAVWSSLIRTRLSEEAGN